MAASMHRVDSIGILSRLASLGCVVRRTYSVRGPLSLVHMDTNHKLIRYNIVLFGGVDRYSRKVMYLGASTNNRASTAYGFFLEATQRHGVPLRRKARGPLLLLPLDCLTLPSPSLLPVAKIRLLLSLYSRLSVAHLHLLSLNLILSRPEFREQKSCPNRATVISYCPKKGKNVLLMSTMHKDAVLSTREDRKPQMVLDYNGTKGGVDNLDKTREEADLSLTVCPSEEQKPLR
ncbi:PiggyBac transposable element-derived protein 4, partial [Dissostichus eleginoides]